MKKIFVLFFAFFSALLLSLTVSAESDSDTAEFYKYLTECANSFEEKIDITDYVLENKWSVSELGTMIKYYYLSEPQLFFVDKEMQIKYNSSKTYFQIDFNYLYTEEQVKKMKKKMRKAALAATEAVTEDMSDAEKALVVHDYIVTNCSYDHEHEGYSAYDCLVKKSCVCQGYTLAYIYVMRDILGIECSAVFSDSQNHLWNYLKIDDNWYHVDLTADDPAFYTLSQKPYDGFASVLHKNFLLNDAQCKKSTELHRNWITLGLPAATGNDFEGLFCEKSSSPVYKIGGLWYYAMMDPDSPGIKYKKTNSSDIYTLIKTFDPKTGKSKTIKKVKSNWFVYRDSSTGEKFERKTWYIESYTKLAMVGDKLYFSTAESVYRLNIKTGKAKKIYTLKKTDSSIYGIAASGDNAIKICYKKDISYKNKYLKLRLS